MTFLDRALTLVKHGYRVIPIPKGRKGPVEKDWESIEADERQVRQWASGFWREDNKGEKVFVKYDDGNIGVLTAHTALVDLDIIDQALVDRLREEVAGIVGASLPIPARVGRAPKCGLLFYSPEPFQKVDSGFFMSPDGAKHKVEVLGVGQQFVAFGIHPDTHKPYEWISEESPLNTPVDELPTITLDQARRIVARFVDLALELGWKRVGNTFKGKFDDAPAAAPAGAVIDMKPKLHVSADEVREALKLMDGFDDYKTWHCVGMGLHHQFDGSEEGFDLWDEWSKQAQEKDLRNDRGQPVYDYEGLRYRWDRSFKGTYEGQHGPITVAFIIKNANDKKREAEEALFHELQALVADCLDFKTLMGPVCKAIAEADLSTMQRGVLTKMVQKAAKKFTGVTVPLKDIVAALRPRVPENNGRDELEVALAQRVLRTRFEDGAYLKRFGGMWFSYQDGVWRQDDAEFIERAVLETLTDLRRLNDKTLRTLIGRMDESRGDRLNALVGTITSILAKLVAERSNDDPLNLRAFEAPRVVNCTNCELWIRDDGDVEVTEHNPAHNLTAQIACDYDELAASPTWDRAIRKVFQDDVDPEDVIRHFYEVFGVIMAGVRDVAMWAMFFGPGGNGKSFLVGVVTRLMGPGSVLGQSIAEIASGTNTHFTWRLVGKLMLVDDDLKTGTLLPDDWLKKFSESKLLTADPKGGQPFEFIARAVPVILTNKWPSTSDLSEGMRRRVLAFESSHVLTEDEKNPAHLREIMANELPGVLNHLIEGVKRFLARGSRFLIPHSCEHAKNRWLSSSNTTARFLEECIEHTTDRLCNVRASELYDHYIQWLRYWEMSAKPLGRNKFYEAMESMRLKRVSHGGVAFYAYVKLRPLEATVVFDDLDDGLDDDDGLGNGDGL